MHDDDGYFGEEVAATYDEGADEMFQPEVVGPTVDFLAQLAGNGRALELGIGTGRIALPLAARGVEVHGIELSKAMAARLRAKPAGQGIEVAIGDYATAKADGTFRLAYLVFNTIMNLTTQAARSPASGTSPSTSSPAATSSSRSAYPTSSGCRPASASWSSMVARPTGASTSTTSRTRA